MLTKPTASRSRTFVAGDGVPQAVQGNFHSVYLFLALMIHLGLACHRGSPCKHPYVQSIRPTAPRTGGERDVGLYKSRHAPLNPIIDPSLISLSAEPSRSGAVRNGALGVIHRAYIGPPASVARQRTCSGPLVSF
jgi:hypothetical protein